MSQRELIFIHEEMLIPHFQSADLFSLFGKRNLCQAWLMQTMIYMVLSKTLQEKQYFWNTWPLDMECLRYGHLYISLINIYIYTKYEYRFVFSDYIFCFLISSKISYIFFHLFLQYSELHLFRTHFKTFLYIFEVDFVDNLLVPNTNLSCFFFSNC